MAAARLEGGRRLPRDQRFCRVCSSGAVEDVAHFLLDCPALAAARRAMNGRLDALDPPPKMSWGDWMHLLLGAPVRVDGTPMEVSRELDTAAMREVLKLACARRRVLYPPGDSDPADSDSSG